MRERVYRLKRRGRGVLRGLFDVGQRRVADLSRKIRTECIDQIPHAHFRR